MNDKSPCNRLHGHGSVVVAHATAACMHAAPPMFELSNWDWHIKVCNASNVKFTAAQTFFLFLKFLSRRKLQQKWRLTLTAAYISRLSSLKRNPQLNFSEIGRYNVVQWLVMHFGSLNKGQNWTPTCVYSQFTRQISMTKKKSFCVMSVLPLLYTVYIVTVTRCGSNVLFLASLASY
jgi:hypothetical protein